MKTTQTLLSIITINYNQAETTNALLRSLQNIEWENFEVIVVDNNSKEEDFRNINTEYNNVQIIRNSRNLGFAGGNNTGIKVARGQFILLLNNDTEVDEDFAEPMISLLQSDSTIGAVSPKIKYYDAPDIIQYAGFTEMNPFTTRMHAIGHKQFDFGEYDEIQETAFAHGCAMMLRRDVLEEVGMMPDEYFLYYEEHDWSSRIKKAGYSIYVQPLSVVYHKESMSVKKNSPLKTYYINRNRILYVKRNFSFSYLIMALLYLTCVSIPKNIFTFLIRKKREHLTAYVDALQWHITHKTKAKWCLN